MAGVMARRQRVGTGPSPVPGTPPRASLAGHYLTDPSKEPDPAKRQVDMAYLTNHANAHTAADRYAWVRRRPVGYGHAHLPGMIPKPLQITTDLRARWPDSGQGKGRADLGILRMGVGVRDRWPASSWSARSVPGGRGRPLCRRSGDTVLTSGEHPAETARGLAGLVRPWWCAGRRSPGAPAIGPCLRPLAGAMVGNGGTAVRVMACCLAWREQGVTGKRSKSCGSWPRGWPRDHRPRQDTFCRRRRRRQ